CGTCPAVEANGATGQPANRAWRVAVLREYLLRTGPSGGRSQRPGSQLQRIDRAEPRSGMVGLEVGPNRTARTDPRDLATQRRLRAEYAGAGFQPDNDRPIPHLATVRNRRDRRRG